MFPCHTTVIASNEGKAERQMLVNLAPKTGETCGGISRLYARMSIQRHPLGSSPVRFISGMGEVGSGHIHDLSVQGMGLLIDRPLDPGTPLELLVPGNSTLKAHFLSAEVKHSTAQNDGRWRIGCAFLRLLSVENAFWGWDSQQPERLDSLSVDDQLTHFHFHHLAQRVSG
jgi:hypothetical protein